MGSPLTVLLVEDDNALREIVETKLRAQGFEVRTACGGIHGYSSYLQQPTELVVTDIQMPELDGFQMMRCIRRINPSVKTIYVTGALERFRMQLGVEKEGFGAIIIAKPCSSEELLRAINSGAGERARWE